MSGWPVVTTSPFERAFNSCVAAGLFRPEHPNASAVKLVPYKGILNPAYVTAIVPTIVNWEGLGINSKEEHIWRLHLAGSAERIYAFRDGEHALTREDWQALPFNARGVNSKQGWLIGRV